MSQRNALATAIATLAALDHIKSKELYMENYYDPKVNHFCVKGAVYEHHAPKKDRIMTFFNKYVKEVGLEKAKETFDNCCDDVDPRDFLANNFDEEILDSIEQQGFGARNGITSQSVANDTHQKNEGNSAAIRKKTYKQVRAFTVALIASLEVKEQFDKVVAKLAKVTIDPYNYYHPLFLRNHD